MPPLQSLQQLSPSINSNFLNFCASHGILTVEDFLVQDVYVLAAFAEDQPTFVELKQGITDILNFIDCQHQPWLNGMDLLQDVCQNKKIFSTGCQGIDLLLQGGLRAGQLTELVGPSPSGKTQVCLQAASHIAHKYAGNVMFFDTCNSFSSKRVAQLVGSFSSPSVMEAKERIVERAMRNIYCYPVFDIFSLYDLLHQLESGLRSQIRNEGSDMHLLVVDSLSSLIIPILGGKGSQGHSLMVSVGFLLKKLANDHNLAIMGVTWRGNGDVQENKRSRRRRVALVLASTMMDVKVTNHMVGGERGTFKPALGESWKTIPHVRLLLSHDHDSNAYNISILKHTCMVNVPASGQVGRFIISDQN